MEIYDLFGRDLTIREGDNFIKRYFRKRKLNNYKIDFNSFFLLGFTGKKNFREKLYFASKNSSLLYLFDSINEYQQEKSNENIKNLSLCFLNNLDVTSIQNTNENIEYDVRLKDDSGSLRMNFRVADLVLYNLGEREKFVPESHEIIMKLKPADTISILFAYLDKDKQGIKKVWRINDYGSKDSSPGPQDDTRKSLEDLIAKVSRQPILIE